MTKKFIRQDFMRHLKLGKKRKKLQKWRRPRGRQSKMRLNMKGYPAHPSVGYKSPRKEAGKIQGYNPVLITNLNELKNMGKNSAVIISRRVGAKKKIEIIKKASEMNLKILNIKQGAKI
ncbi:50S ribosomal protein L32e [Candidatus Pacearchaeota archaeon]|nr:50S ribosomal protein L32e [Candidatus Pacearchaeota archaeon]